MTDNTSALPPVDKPEHYEQLLAAITPEIHAQLRRAIELGKWPNGDRLSPEQLEHSLQAVIAWEAQHLPEQDRIGYIDRSKLSTDTCPD